MNNTQISMDPTNVSTAATALVDHLSDSAASTVSTTANVVATSTDEILKTYLIKALDNTGNLIDKSVDMVMEQAPILVNEVLHWYFAYNLLWFIVGLVMCSSVLAYWYHQFAWGTKQEKLNGSEQSPWFDGDAGAVRYIFNALLFIPFVIGAVNMNIEWLKIWISPRLWLIEYTTNLIKHHH